MLLLSLLLLTAGMAFASDQIPAPPQKGPVALAGGTIHTVSGPVIERGTVLFDRGKIVEVGAGVRIPSGALTVDITGKHVYPGLIEAYSHLGLIEIGAVRGTVDTAERGSVNPNIRAETAINPDSERIPVTRSNGIAITAVVPLGGIVSGKSAVIMLDGWTGEDMTLKAPAGMVVDWPEKKEGREELEKAFREARAYRAALAAPGKKDAPHHKADVRWEALIPVLNGELPLWIFANGAGNIEAAVEWADREKVTMVLMGGTEANRVADLLKHKNIPVLVTPILRQPDRAEAGYDEPYSLPAQLYRAGVRFCIAGGDERNLPYHAGLAAAYGLPREEALKAVTQYAAEILGIGDRAGTLEKGRDATLIVTTGDPLEPATLVEKLYIQGKDVDLSDKQKNLYRKYREKYQQRVSKR